MSKEDNKIVWRRAKVLELSSQGHSQRDISRILQVGSAYNQRSSIQTKLSEHQDNNSSEGSESSEGSREDTCTAIQV
jgi:hypothetical protein